MLGFKIWLLAQFINACFYIYVGAPIGAFLIIISIAGGLPLIFFFNAWMTFIERRQIAAKAKAILTLVALPILTAIGAIAAMLIIGQMFVIGDMVMYPIAIIPSAATLAATLLFIKSVSRLSFVEEDDRYSFDNEGEQSTAPQTADNNI